MGLGGSPRSSIGGSPAPDRKRRPGAAANRALV